MGWQDVPLSSGCFDHPDVENHSNYCKNFLKNQHKFTQELIKKGLEKEEQITEEEKDLNTCLEYRRNGALLKKTFIWTKKSIYYDKCINLFDKYNYFHVIKKQP